MVAGQGSTRSEYLEVYWPHAGGLSAVNAIGTQMRDPINSGLTDGVCCLKKNQNVPRPSVVDPHNQRIVLATKETTVTQQVSHRPIKCQSRLWSQRGTKVNWSHHGNNPLLRPTGILLPTKRYAALQAMAPTNISKRFIKPPYSISRATSIDSECCRLPTTSVLSKKTKKNNIFVK